MARRRYYYRRVVRPKQKWAINNVDIRIAANPEYTITVPNNVFVYQVVVQNGNRVQNSTGQPATSVVSSAQILKTGRFKFKGCSLVQSNLFSITVFIAYVPEGYGLAEGVTSDQNIFYQHPEWIIAWTRKDYANSAQSNEISLTSRLKRNLNTGDQIIVGVLLNNSTSANQTTSNLAVLQGTLSYCCRAN